jgi:3,4-dihydroxy 2-butanone 4-phosphate synthase/GTP cyclohydrolase II
MRILTNNPRKIFGLEGFGLKIVGRVPMQTPPTPFNTRYMQTKRKKLGHIFEEQGSRESTLPHGDHA